MAVEVTLKKGRDRAIRRRHPWIFEGAIASVSGNPALGDVVTVRDSRGEVLGKGAFSPTSQIRVRMWTFANEDVDEKLLHARVDAAVALRKRWVLGADTNCARLVFAENDGLPGFVADLYDDTLVVQCQSAGAERNRDVLVARLAQQTGARRVFERSDADVRKLEGLVPRAGPLKGDAPTEPVKVSENGIAFLVDVVTGHKTGFYLDQRDSRARVRSLAKGRRVLNCFSYTGGFAVAALKGGAASAISVDTSMAALEMAERNVAANGIPEPSHEGIKGDCFDVMRGLYDDGERFDLVVLDPPKFAPSAAHVDKAARGYKDLAIRGLKLLAPGGLLFTFSCSGAIDRALFRSIVASAALESGEAGQGARIVGELGHPMDHGVSTAFPEGEYLKGVVVALP